MKELWSIRWFLCCSASKDKEKRSDSRTTLNVHVVESIPNNVLGYAFLPNQYPEDNSMHGIVMGGGTFPGGANAPYNLGDTLVHEAGHYLGMSCQ